MAQVINTNVFSLNSQRQLNKSQASLQVSLERLSSGLRINRAKDDAAGLAISERFTAQVRGLEQANRNANDGISLLQTAEGAMDEIANSLQRMRELAVQSANGTVSNADKNSLDDEFQELKREIIRITDTAEFNNTNLLGTNASIKFQVGFENGSTNQIKISTINLSTAGTASGGIRSVLASNLSIGSGGNANSAISLLSRAIDAISAKRADFGAKQNRLEATVRNNANIVENQSAARSRILDADFARETANLTRNQILQQAGVAMLSQANALPQSVLSLLG
ncbi:MAG: flagellin FliC [Chromatiales bacterium]|nr:flagellin FliC [Chromatiales bacterium]